MKSNIIVLLLLSIIFTSCVSTKSTLKNVDETTQIPTLSKSNTFVITTFSKDKKYGYDKDFPINVFYKSATNETINQQRFLDALTGPKGEIISYKKKEFVVRFRQKTTQLAADYSTNMRLLGKV